MPIDKIIDPNVAANAYSSSSSMGLKGVSGRDDGVSFSDFLKDKIGESVDTMKESERMSAQAVTGEADLVDVVEAVTAAELTLQTVMAVRDKMISAYQEILRMPI